MSGIKATIIILDFLKARQVIKNVESILLQSVDFDFKIIVIDNSCNENNAAILGRLSGKDKVVLYVNDKNLGYTKAHNKVKNEIEGEYVFIVNPDIEWIDKQAMQKMLMYMDKHQEIGVLGPKQVNKDGAAAMSIRAFPKLYLQIARRTFLRNLPWLKEKVLYDEMRHLDYDKIQDVDWLQSSCVAVRRSLWEDINGLNEDYFLFMSDVEICFDAWKRKKKVVYYPEAAVRADGKRVSDGGFKMFFKSWVLRQHVKDSLKYRLKHLLEGNPRLKFINK